MGFGIMIMGEVEDWKNVQRNASRLTMMDDVRRECLNVSGGGGRSALM